MEPAAERREHGMHKMMTGVTDDVPQWSPPVNGGSTRYHAMAHGHYYGPQWSPPVNGGSTHYHAMAHGHYYGPQWSPPVNGGSSRPVQFIPDLAADAAMEPAAERREQPAGWVTDVPGLSRPQWSPPLNGGSRARKFWAV